eukprot:365469-Chlamydomonas_euryale.AAC.6
MPCPNHQHGPPLQQRRQAWLDRSARSIWLCHIRSNGCALPSSAVCTLACCTACSFLEEVRKTPTAGALQAICLYACPARVCPSSQTVPQSLQSFPTRVFFRQLQRGVAVPRSLVVSDSMVVRGSLIMRTATAASTARDPRV